MGKVKDGTTPASKATSKPAAPAANRGGRAGRFAPFLANLARADLYKPAQGKYARGWTGVGLAVILVLGLWQLVDALDAYGPPVRFGVPAVLLVVLGWVIFRVLQYPPFAEFLVATEAEMNKVSWTTRDDLRRATTVVLTTVLLMSLYLFGVDWVWSQLLHLLGVLNFESSGFGSTAG